MNSIYELIKRKEFTRNNLYEIYQFCKIQGDLSPLLAVIFVAVDQKIDNNDILTYAKLLAKYPELINPCAIRTQLYQEE